MKIPKRLGMILLGVWLVVAGLSQLISLPIPSLTVILAILAIAAGVLIILGKTE